MKSFSKRMDAFGTSIFTELKAMKLAYMEETGKEPIDFSIGSPNIPPAEPIVRAMKEAMDVPENFKYAITELPELLEAVQDWYQNRYDVSLDPNQIVCMSGTQEALSTICLALCDPDDLVLVPDPCYPVFQDGPKIAGAQVAYMPLKEENDYLIQLDEIDEETAKKAKLMVVSYPNNPTCATAPDWFYEKLIAFAKRYDIMVIHDNAYSELIFDGSQGRSFLSYPGAMEIGVEMNSLSKTFGLAGARIGVCVGNKEMIGAYRMLKSNMDYGIFLPVQRGGIEALRHCMDTIPATRKAYKDRRDVLSAAFQKAGWIIEPSPATMFAWAPIPKNYTSSNAFVKDLLKKTGVVVTPGESFGQYGMRYVRFALVQDVEQIREAARRIQASGLFAEEKR